MTAHAQESQSCPGHAVHIQWINRGFHFLVPVNLRALTNTDIAFKDKNTELFKSKKLAASYAH